MVPFLEAKPLEEQQTESLSIPVVSHTEGSLLEHCRRAIARSASVGPHGLPLMEVAIGTMVSTASVWAAKARACGSPGLRSVSERFAELLTLRELSEEAQACAPAPPSSQRPSTLRRGTERGIAAHTLTMALLSDPRNVPKPGSIRFRQTWAAISGRRQPRSRRDRAAIARGTIVREADNLILLSPRRSTKLPRHRLHQGVSARRAGNKAANTLMPQHGLRWLSPSGRWDEGLRAAADAESGRASGEDDIRSAEHEVNLMLIVGDVLRRPCRVRRRLDLVVHVRRLRFIWVWLEEVLASIAAVTRHDQPRHTYRIGPLSVCITLIKTPLIASRSRIPITVPAVLRWWKWMGLRSPTRW